MAFVIVWGMCSEFSLRRLRCRLLLRGWRCIGCRLLLCGWRCICCRSGWRCLSRRRSGSRCLRSRCNCTCLRRGGSSGGEFRGCRGSSVLLIRVKHVIIRAVVVILRLSNHTLRSVGAVGARAMRIGCASAARDESSVCRRRD